MTQDKILKDAEEIWAYQSTDHSGRKRLFVQNLGSVISGIIKPLGASGYKRLADEITVIASEFLLKLDTDDYERHISRTRQQVYELQRGQGKKSVYLYLAWLCYYYHEEASAYYQECQPALRLVFEPFSLKPKYRQRGLSRHIIKPEDPDIIHRKPVSRQESAGLQLPKKAFLAENPNNRFDALTFQDAEYQIEYCKEFIAAGQVMLALDDLFRLTEAFQKKWVLCQSHSQWVCGYHQSLVLLELAHRHLFDLSDPFYKLNVRRMHAKLRELSSHGIYSNDIDLDRLMAEHDAAKIMEAKHPQIVDLSNELRGRFKIEDIPLYPTVRTDIDIFGTEGDFQRVEEIIKQSNARVERLASSDKTLGHAMHVTDAIIRAYMRLSDRYPDKRGRYFFDANQRIDQFEKFLPKVSSLEFKFHFRIRRIEFTLKKYAGRDLKTAKDDAVLLEKELRKAKSHRLHAHCRNLIRDLDQALSR